MNREIRDRPALWLFDFDNTIARLEPVVDWAASRRELEAALRAAKVPEDLFSKFPRGNLLLYEELRGRLLDSVPARETAAGGDAGRKAAREILERASRIIEKHELTGAERAVAMQGAEELLRVLNSLGCSSAIVTSNSSRTVGRWLERHCLREIVRAIVGRDTLLPLKPSPDMIVHALEICAARPEDAVFVGDSEADFRAAVAAGVSFYAIHADPAGRERLIALGATQIFASPAALAIHLNLPGVVIHKHAES
jgi:HAD superfamily hydrolase (TIGR01509 family)